MFMWSGNKNLRFDKGSRVYPIFKSEGHYSSTAQSCSCKQYSPVESRLLPVETVPHPSTFELGTWNLAFPFFLTAYN